MGKLVELLALALIRKGLDAAVAWATATEVAASLGSPGDGGSCGCDPLASCRMLGRSDLEDDCYAWDLPRSTRHRRSC